MTRVTNDNFQELYPIIEKAVQEASFLAIDAEFSGLVGSNAINIDAVYSNESLFDTPPERYAKLRENIAPFAALQFGLTAFVHQKHKNEYIAKLFDFHLMPRAIPTRNRIFLCQGSALEFLARHSFDFNELVYNGLSYLDELEEADLRHTLENKLLLNETESLLSFDGEDELRHSFEKLQNWLKTETDSNAEKTLIFETSSVLMHYILQAELRSFYKNIWTESFGINSFSVMKVTEDTHKSLEKEEDANNSLSNGLFDYFMGFSKVFKLITSIKKPIVGHNMLLDLMFIHKLFYQPLPRRYETFKSNIHRLFPFVYDTKYLSFEMKNVLHEKSWKSNILEHLYNYFKDGPGRYLALNSPTILPPESLDNSSKETFHNAGWDSYCTGYCFIRMAHIYAVRRLSSNADMRIMTNVEIMSGAKDRINRVNLIRADLSHVRLDGPDPESTRPRWLHVQLLGGVTTTRSMTRQIAQDLSRFGMVDVKRFSDNCLLLAASNHSTARSILEYYEKNSELLVVPYNRFAHSITRVKVLIWTVGSFLISGIGVFAWSLHRSNLS